MTETSTTPVYEPDDDSYLLLSALQKELQDIEATGRSLPSLHFLDMGAGNGFLGFDAMKKGFRTTFVDINPLAIQEITNLLEAEDLHAPTICSDLFANVPKTAFDVIAFNTPYLPADEELFDPALHGGEHGYETTLRFLAQAKSYLAPRGIIIFLTSSLAQPEVIQRHARELGFACEQIASEKLFFEELFVYKLHLS
jgi:release factor glutamine methyltransferase